MALFLLSFLVITVSVAGLALGVIVRKRPIGAGCGKYSGPEVLDAACEVCIGAGRSERSLAAPEVPGRDDGLQIDVPVVAHSESDAI